MRFSASRAIALTDAGSKWVRSLVDPQGRGPQLRQLAGTRAGGFVLTMGVQ
jgi:hypothetical protein